MQRKYTFASRALCGDSEFVKVSEADQSKLLYTEKRRRGACVRRSAALAHHMPDAVTEYNKI